MMTTATTSSYKLKVPADWHLWFSNLQAKATDLDLWEYIDPAGTRQLTAPEPVDPTDYKKVGQFRVVTRDDDGNEVFGARRNATQHEYNMLRAQGTLTDPEYPLMERVRASQLTDTERKEWLADVEEQKRDDRLYERHHSSMGKLRKEVVDSIDESLHIYFRGAVTLREVIVRLKDRLAPKDATQVQTIFNDWNLLMKSGPGKGVNYERWVSDVEYCLEIAGSYEAAWISDTHIISGQILKATGKVAPSWADATRKELLDHELRGTAPQPIRDLVASFRAWMRQEC